jgi:hypothetical protein
MGAITRATGVGIALGFLSVLLIVPILVYLGTIVIFYFSVLWLEDLGIFASMRRSFQLIWGKWWSTFGLLFVASLIQGMVSIVFALPQYAVMMGKMLQLPGLSSDLLGVVAQTFYAVGILFTYCIPLLALAFQYFNLVERHEGYGLRLLVDGLGQSAPTARSHHYQPDEEGEY